MTDDEAAKIRKMLDEWDASGAVKTSAYYRLLSSITTPKSPTPRKENHDEKTPLRPRHS